MIPEDVKAAAAELGFQLRCWKDGEGAISGHGQEFVGSQSEVRAYLIAWSACLARAAWQTDQDKAAEHDAARITRHGIVLASGGTIEPGDSAQLTTRPQDVPFRGDRLVVLDECAALFDIDDLKVGNRSQLPQSRPMPAAFCAARISSQTLFGCEIKQVMVRASSVKIQIAEPALAEFGRPWTMETCQTAQDISMAVTNRSNRPSCFVALIVGR
jgi:hypothetical protein